MHFFKNSKFQNLTVYLLITLAVVDLIGWGFDVSVLTRLSSAMPAMSVFTACSFILSALGLINIRYNYKGCYYRFCNVLLALLIACFSCLSLAVNFNVDSNNFLTTELLLVSSPITSSVFLLSALSIGTLATTFKAIYKISQLFALIMMAIVLLVFTSYLSEAIYIYQFRSGIGVAFPTAIGLLFLSVALFFVFPQMAIAGYLLQHSIAAAAQRHLLPAAVILPLLTFVVGHILQKSDIIFNEATNAAMSSFITILMLIFFTVYLRRYINNTENQFDIMVNSAPVMIWMADTRGHTFFFNKQWLEFTGRDLDNEKSTNFDQCVHPDDIAHTYAVYIKAFSQKEAFSLEYRLRHHSGEFRTVLEKGMPYLGVKGLFEGFIGSCVDISKNKQLQIKLEKNNQALNEEVVLRERLEQEQYRRSEILECLSAGQSLQKILNKIIANIEMMNPEILGSVLLFDEQHQCLHHGAALSLPDFFIQALDAAMIETDKTPYGIAAYTKQSVIVDDILAHPYWVDYKDLVIQAGFKASWSIPIFSSKKDLLGIFAFYYREPHRVDQDEIDSIDKMVHLAAIAIAIERKQDEEALRIAAQTFQSHEAILVSDANNNILRVNSAFTKITGYTETEVLGKNPKLLSSGRQDEAFYLSMYEALDQKGTWEGEIWNRRKDGSLYPEWLTVTGVKNYTGILTHYVAIFSDITDRKNAEQEIYNLAFYDPLTALANRRLLLDRLKQEIITSKRHQSYGSIIFFDLDKFKMLNDSFGHQAGDELLIQAAQRIKSVIREGDTACRLGGDEFVVLISSYENDLRQAADNTMIVAEKIRHTINQPFILESGEHIISASIGITMYPELSDQADVILQQADTAMYQSKSSGRNSIHFFQPSMQELAEQHILMEKELRIAIKEEQFIVHYQPQVDQNGQIISAEALVRWQHPVKGLVSPGEFIPIAEDTLLILSIGRWVMRTVCQQIREWEDKGLHLSHISVNVSAKQFRQDNFVDQVNCFIDETGISADRLMLELTESILIDDVDDTVNKMCQLNKRGITFSIDDFGTGYSSLSYLKQLPLKELKIDQHFIRDITTDVNDAVIVETIMAMAHSLGLDAIAEGVELKEQMDFLKEKNCPSFQGYYFSRPVTSDNFFTLMQGKKS